VFASRPSESRYVLNAATSAAGTMLLPVIPAKHGHGSAFGAVLPCPQAAEVALMRHFREAEGMSIG
jgi:hypothetical protein